MVYDKATMANVLGNCKWLSNKGAGVFVYCAGRKKSTLEFMLVISAMLVDFYLFLEIVFNLTLITIGIYFST